MNMIRVVSSVLMLVIFLFAGSIQAQHALPQTSSSAPSESAAAAELRAADLSGAEIDDLVARLSDEEVRQILLERLDAVAAKQAVEAEQNRVDVFANIESAMQTVRGNVSKMFIEGWNIPSLFVDGYVKFLDGRPAWVLPLVLGVFALMIAVGYGVEWIFNRYIHRAREWLLKAQPTTLLSRFGFLIARLGVDLACLIVFSIAAIAVFFAFYQGHDLTRSTVMTYLTAIMIVRFASVVSRFMLAPHAQALRMVDMDDEGARHFHRMNVIAVAIGAFGFLTGMVFERMGLFGPRSWFMVWLVGAIMFSTISYSIFKGRAAITADLAIDGKNRIRSVFARVWPYAMAGFIILYFITIFILANGGIDVGYGRGLGTAGILLLLPHLDAMLERSAITQRVAAHGKDNFRIVILRALRIAVIGTVVLILTRLWDFDIQAVASAGLGDRISNSLTSIALTALVAYVLWEFTRIAIDRKMAEESGPAPEEAESGGEGGGQGASRLSTLLPLIKITLQVTIAVMSIMIVLSELGVNIGPLLAGAGVIGLAVGFGAQTLVKDIVSGLFFLVDDAFRMGEYIDTGTVKGTVEKISVRSLRLRHQNGPLNTIPFGEISHLINYSRDWVIVKLMFRVPFDTDIDKVRKLFKQVGKQLLADPEIGPDFLEPLKSQGVYDIDDSAIILRAKFTAKPGKQFLIRRQVYIAVQQMFADNGIEFAPKQVIVRAAEGEKPSAAELQNAAASSVQIEDQAPGKPA